ncbi:BA14K family protein [Kumtagia ephedrae]|jgi:hypothetical protein|uniref:Lectin-like protein BA14k n=1 Tax=Kumtagia ephedrae TaxID=2116701 RepID=A0A2P7SCB0_9HYPH|nr:BA14K family protein [Mesorhizobium ephedrae]PSJ60130.1 BA14K family protein [Mesorhizobium ephedrae]
MKKFLSGLCATALALAVTVTGLLPAGAAPAYVPKAGAEVNGDVVKVQDARKWRRDRREFRRDRREFRRDRREWRRDRREARRDFRRDRGGYYRGYRGYRDYRPGYRRYGDYWYPAAAFVAGALIGGAIANAPAREVYRDGGDAHTQWCYNRYRSYRAYDNTFQPYNGPRQQCFSPYS